MADNKEHLDQTRLALAALAACIAQTLGEQDSTFVPRLNAHLENIYLQLRDSEADNLGAIETIGWVREFLRG